MTHNADGDDYSPKKGATFVYYEYTQLDHVAKALRSLTKGQRADSLGGRHKTDAEQIQESILLTAFLVHARNLRAFLFPPPPPAPKPKPDDVLAKHFLPEWAEKVEDWCPHFLEHRERLNKSLAHISYKRIEYEADKFWECGTIHKELTDAWNEFVGRLTPEEQDWFTAPRK